MTHRIAFNCDLFMDVEAPAEATSEDLERHVIARWRDSSPGAIQTTEDIGFTVPALGDDVRIHPRVEGPRNVSLENFTVENVSQ